MGWARLFLWLVLVPASLFGSASVSFLAPHLDPSSLQSWIKNLEGPFGDKNLEEFETGYQSFVQPQTFRDLQQIYAPENQEKLRIGYPAFIPEGGKAGPDRGFGFHVVKRLVMALPNGEEKVIDVNEQWAENQKNRGLLFPDEIRIKTRVVSGERYVPGSERQYVFDSIRLAWSESNEIFIGRQTRYVHRDGINKMKQLRVSVSAPISCVACHDASSNLYSKFISQGETRNHEAIVQDSYFKRSLSDMRGYQEYVAYLESRKVSETFLSNVKRDLNDPIRSFAVPGLYEALEKGMTSFSWLTEDKPLQTEPFFTHTSQGAYAKQGRWYVDVTESIFEGKYRWWLPRTVIPAGTRFSPLFHLF